jgi:hypothetical protein
MSDRRKKVEYYLPHHIMPADATISVHGNKTALFKIVHCFGDSKQV